MAPAMPCARGRRSARVHAPAGSRRPERTHVARPAPPAERAPAARAPANRGQARSATWARSQRAKRADRQARSSGARTHRHDVAAMPTRPATRQPQRAAPPRESCRCACGAARGAVRARDPRWAVRRRPTLPRERAGRPARRAVWPRRYAAHRRSIREPMGRRWRRAWGDLPHRRPIRCGRQPGPRAPTPSLARNELWIPSCPRAGAAC